MFKSEDSINAAMLAFEHDTSSPEFIGAAEEHHEGGMFWDALQELRYAGVSPSDELEKYRAFYKSESLTEHDVDFLSTYDMVLGNEACFSSDADEGIRIMQDFFQLEDGLEITRSVKLAGTGPLSRNLCDDELWLQDMKEYLSNPDGIRSDYSSMISDQTLRNACKAVLHVLERSDGITVSEGLFKSIMMPFELLRERDQESLLRSAA